MSTVAGNNRVEAAVAEKVKKDRLTAQLRRMCTTAPKDIGVMSYQQVVAFKVAARKGRQILNQGKGSLHLLEAIGNLRPFWPGEP